MPVKVVLGKDLIEENKRKAEDLKAVYSSFKVKVVNFLSSPGAGKTSLLEATIAGLTDSGIRVGVIEGDIATTRDADRVAKLGVPTVQITTMGSCHLDAAMMWKALSQIDLSGLDLLFIENVGNLVCPSEFDLGEDLRVTVLSVTEGNDKPAKYPHAFLTSQVVVINKTDLIPYTDWDETQVMGDLKAVNPSLRIFKLSCRTKEGIPEWLEWLKNWVPRRDNHAQR